jgi:hypothetical protein
MLEESLLTSSGMMSRRKTVINRIRQCRFGQLHFRGELSVATIPQITTLSGAVLFLSALVPFDLKSI